MQFIGLPGRILKLGKKVKIMNYDSYLKKWDVENPPKPRKIYFAYANGKVLGQYDTYEKAKFLSNTVDWKFDDSYTEEKQAWDARFKEMDLTWRKDLRAQYTWFPDDTYNIIFARAWEEGHHAGWHEVQQQLSDLSDFAEKILTGKN